MYLHPFCSFHQRPDGEITIVNSLSRSSVTIGTATLDALRALVDTGRFHEPVSTRDIERLEACDVLFVNRSASEAWVEAWYERQEQGVPKIDQIELTNRCPYRCKMCPRTTSMTRAIGDMDLALFTRIIDQIKDNQSYVGLHHFGESLVHRGLTDAVTIALDRGVRTGLSCNPPSLKPVLAENLLRAGLAEMLLSLDSLDAATYRSIRGPAADIGRALTHLRSLMTLRDRTGATTHITLQLISMRENADEIPNFLKLCRELGVDRGVVVDVGRWDFTDDKIAELGEFDPVMHDGFCTRPVESVAVLWDGRVVPCCHDYDGAEVLGNLRTQTLDEIWASDAARKFRADPNATALCQNCAFSRGYRETWRAQIGFDAFHRSRSNRKKVEILREDTGPHQPPYAIGNVARAN
ncbi:radical SAM protein [Roseibium aggregatum]|uniref:radical SAM protein n=1 Tax=Roseibium aggregatum TaxID=187304 RepID=UPI0025AB7CB6|nr:radical SAM protein [Roseibium aggregatum]WJS05545.1 radical SAM protein [Roseibium aggregatum]